MRTWLLSVGLGTALYLAVVGRISVAATVEGAAVALLTAWLVGGDARGTRSHSGAPRTLLRHLPGLVIGPVLVGAWRVALVIVGLRPLPRSEIVELEFDRRAGLQPGFWAMLETLSPGTFLLDLDVERRVMRFHVLDVEEVDALRRRHAALWPPDAGERETTS